MCECFAHRDVFAVGTPEEQALFSLALANGGSVRVPFVPPSLQASQMAAAAAAAASAGPASVGELGSDVESYSDASDADEDTVRLYRLATCI